MGKSKKESSLYYFNSVGCAICKQIDPIIEKLNKNGHDILILNIDEETNNGLKREIENKYNLRCGTPFFVDVSNGNNICGGATEQMIEKWANGEHMPEPPKPKSPAPPLPTDFDDDKQIKNFSKEYDKWALGNKHLPNLQTSTQIIERFKKQWEDRKNQQKSLDSRISVIEEKLDKLMNHLGVK